MQPSDQAASLEEQIDQWRGFLRHRQAIQSVDIAELEDHLREQIGVLTNAGLANDEAFLVAVKRMGALDALSREFAREHSDRLWKQLVISPADQLQGGARTDALVAFGVAALAALLIKVPAVFGIDFHTNVSFYFRNFSLFVLPLLAGYFAWKRQLNLRILAWLAAGFAVAIVVAIAYPQIKGDLEGLTALHLPIALWLLVGIAYAGGRWAQVEGRMDFIRFSGELFIYYTLIALGGGVLVMFLQLIFQSAGISIDLFFQNWLLPCGAAGAAIVASWLVEAKQSVVENMAPVLARLFTPLFTIALIVFLGTLVFTGRGIDIDRNLLIAFDVLLVLVLGLVLYSISARDPTVPAGAYDALQVVLILSALAADAVALGAIAARINEMGFTPNRVAALGENLILLVNLAWSAVLYVQFLRKRGSFADIERWQTGYLLVFAGWAAIVVLAFPPAFGFK
ncbi:MAG TPA: permease prefix domain 1-containing protein [Hyphomonadaceae bacterium]|nr:permease prefix domain 1-containing protein [Hyphomonadaceae bacterium]